MRKDIQYRDLPGGPLMVKFADELPLCSLCSKCGMLSKDMFEDPSSHAFCSICIFECSDRKKIHCKYENKDVSVEEMMPAIDIINVVMDQVVFCPNTSDGNSCTKYCTLKDLEGHYLECEKTKIICLSCGDTVKGRDWKTHVTSCPQQIMQCCYCVVAVPRFRLELHERLCSYNPNAVREADTSPTAAMDFTSRQSSDWARNEKQLPVSVNTNKPHLIPEAKVKLATDATDAHMPRDLSKVDDDVLLSCPKCNRNVKSKNMDKHISVCTQRTNGPSSLEARQTPEIAPEVAAVASDMGSLQSSYVMLSVSDIPTEDDVTVHGHYLGARQGREVSQVAAGYIVGTQTSRSEETSGHSSGVHQESGYSQMAASNIVQTQPSRSEEAPDDHRRSSSRKSNTSSQSLQPPIGKWPQQLQQGDWGGSKTTNCSGNSRSARKTPHRSRYSMDKSQLTLRWSKHQCFETIEYYADVSSYYDEPKCTDADNDYDAIEHNRFPGPTQRDGHNERSVVDGFVQTNATL